MLSVIILNVVILSVVAPKVLLFMTALHALLLFTKIDKKMKWFIENFYINLINLLQVAITIVRG
jgi:hypothetical protein